MGNLTILIFAFLTVGFLEYADLGTTNDDFFEQMAGVPVNTRRKREVEVPERLQTLLDNIIAIEEHNSLFDQGEVTFKMKLNKFAYESYERFAQLRNGLKMFAQTIPVPDGMKNFLRQAARFVSQINSQVTGTVDWRIMGIDSEVKDQEECASCWAFSTIGAIEGQVHRRTGRSVNLSPQNLVDCATSDYGSNGCNGGSMEGSYRYIKEHGINPAITYPYEGKTGTCRQQTALNAVYISGYRKIQEGNETELREAVARVGPVAVGIDASQRSFQFYSAGIYYDPLCSSSQLDHGVLVVGYGTTPSGIDYWVVKNSYGADWGEGGYFRIARNRRNHCGIATLATYPVI